VSLVQPKVDVTIVGGGFAGLAAALRLHRTGAKIQIVEKRPFFGGRAYSFRDRESGETLDNGQHLLMGCYHETLKFLKDLGTIDRLAIQDQLEISFAHLPRAFHRLRCPNLPAPFHLLLGLASFSGLALKDKWRMAAFLRRAKKLNSNGQDLDQVSVRTFLETQGQSPEAIQRFWEPIGLGALNEALELASAELFLEVIRRALLSNKADSNLALSTVGLSELYAEPARRYFEANSVPMHFQTQVQSIQREGSALLLSTDRQGILKTDKVLFALPPNSLGKILAASPPELHSLAPHLELFQSSPIVSINLWIDGFAPAETMVGLIDSPVHWLFNKSRILKGEKASHVTLVISGAAQPAAQKKEELVAMACAELKKFYPELEGKRLLHSQVVKEFDATFGTRVGLKSNRPSAITSSPGIFLAGDWTDTGLPATIESAVLSGHRAADGVLAL
jgi:zeta-carotene desaturase